MGRPRTPLERAEANGDVEKNKKRFAGRQKTPKYGGTLGPAPMHFTPERILLWDEVVGRIPESVLVSADAYIVEIAVVLLEKFRLGASTATEIGHLRASLGSLGMTPADRTRVNAASDAEEKNDPLALLLGPTLAGKAN